MNKGITVGQLIDLIDINREGTDVVQICERDGDWTEVRTDSMLLDLIGECAVDSIEAKDGQVRIWLDRSCVEQYWKKKGAEDGK